MVESKDLSNNLQFYNNHICIIFNTRNCNNATCWKYVAKLQSQNIFHMCYKNIEVLCLSIKISIKIFLIQVYLLKYYFESHLIYNKLRYYRQTIFNQLNIILSCVDIIGLCHSVIFFEKSMWCSLNVMWWGCASISSAC